MCCTIPKGEKIMLTHKGTTVLETPRLILRRAQVSDAEPMFYNWASDDEVTRFLTWPTYETVDTAYPILEHWVKSYENPDFYLWMIVPKELGQPIGSISVVNHRDDIAEAEIGYCIGKRWWHKGIMTEALHAVMDYLFDEVGMNRIEAKHDVYSRTAHRDCGTPSVMTRCSKSNSATFES